MTQNVPPLISIITPTYNHASYISACIESLQRQTYSHWEQIIIDDGSPDSTAQVVVPYLSDPRITYIRQENRGIWCLAENYNAALRMSRGSLVAILEGDDLWPQDRLATQVPVFADSSVGLSYGRISTVDHDGQPCDADTARRNAWKPPFASFEAASPLPFLGDLLMLRGNVGAVSVMFRRSALEAAGGFWQPDYFPAVDFTTLLRVATRHRTSFIDRVLGYWRRHAGQTTDIRGLDYVLGHSRAAIEYFRSLEQTQQVELGITEDDIVRARRKYMANAYWGATRSSMRAHNWVKARRYALELMQRGTLTHKVKGLVSVFASLLHVNIDPLIESAAHLLPQTP